MKLFNRAKRIAAVTAASVILVSGASVPSQAEDGAGASLIDVSPASSAPSASAESPASSPDEPAAPAPVMPAAPAPVAPLRAPAAGNGFAVEEAAGGVTITGLGGVTLVGGALTIPAEIDGKKVVGIGPRAFRNAGVKTLEFADGLELDVIGDAAFQGNEISGELKVPAKEIGENAFAQNKIKDLELSGTTVVAKDAFRDNEIASLKLNPPAGETVDLAERAFINNRLKGTVDLNKVGKIGDDTFSTNDLREAKLGENTSLGSGVFKENNAWVKLTTPEGAQLDGSIKTVEYESGFGQIVDPVKVIVRYVDDKGAQILPDETLGEDLTAPGPKFQRGKETTHTPRQVSGYKLDTESITFTPDKDGYVIEATYTKVDNKPVFTFPKDGIRLNNGEEATPERLKQGVSARSHDGKDITNKIQVDGSAIDTKTTGLYEAVFSVVDDEGNETVETVPVFVGADWGEYEFGGGWQVKDFVYTKGGVVEGFSESGKAKLAAGNTTLWIPPVTTEGTPVTTIGYHAFYKTPITSIEGGWQEVTLINTAAFEYSSLSKIPDDWGGVKLIYQGAFSNSEIAELPASWGDVEQLDYDVFRNNQLTRLPDSWGKITVIPGAVFMGNKIESLPQSWGNVRSIGSGAFKENALTTLPESWGNVTGIGSEAFAGDWRNQTNKINALPKSWGNVKNLGSGAFQYNEIESIPDNWGQLTWIQNDLFRSNKLKEIPASWGNITRIGQAAFQRNEIAHVPPSWENVKDLGKSAFAYNQITEIPQSWGQLGKLNDGIFESNRLTKIPDSWEQFTEIGTQTFQNNDLTELPASWERIKKIGQSAFSKNRIAAVPESWSEVAEVHDWAFSENNIERLPVSWGKINKLGYASFRNNPLKIIPDSWGEIDFIDGGVFLNTEITSLPKSWGKVKRFGTGTFDVAPSAVPGLSDLSFEVPTENLTQNFLDTLIHSKLPRPVTLYTPDRVTPEGLKVPDGVTINPMKVTVRFVDESGNPIGPKEDVRETSTRTLFNYQPPGIYGYEGPPAISQVLGPDAEQEIVLVYKKIPADQLPSNTNISLNLNNKDPYYIGKDMTGSIKVDRTGNATDTLRNVRVFVHFDPEVYDVENFDITAYNLGIDRGTIKKEGSMVSFVIKSLSPGQTLTIPFRLKFYPGPTAANTDYPLQATITDENNLGLAESNVESFQGYYSQPRETISVPGEDTSTGEISDYDQAVNKDDPNNPVTYVADNDPQRPVKNTLDYNICVSGLQRNVGDYQLTVPLPEYPVHPKSANYDPDNPRRLAEFDPEKNPGWEISTDGKQLVYTGHNGDGRANICKSLTLGYPGAVENEKFSLNASAIMTPTGKPDTERHLATTATHRNFFGRSVPPPGEILAKIPTGNHGDARNNYFYDNARERGGVFPWSIVYEMPSAMSGVVFTDYGLDQRMYYDSVTVPMNLGTVTVRVLDDTGAELQADTVESASNRTITYERNKVLKAAKIRFEVKDPVPEGLQGRISVSTRLKDPDAPIGDESGARVFENRASLQANDVPTVNVKAKKTVKPHDQKITAFKTQKAVNAEGKPVDNLITGDFLEYTVGFTPNESFGETITDIVVVDLLPPGLDVYDITMTAEFSRLPGARYEVVDNYRDSGQAAVIFRATSASPDQARPQERMTAGWIKGRINLLGQDRLRNDVFVKATNTGLNNAVTDKRLGDDKWSQAQREAAFTPASAMEITKQIREHAADGTVGAWTNSVTTLPGAKIDYRFRLTNGTERPRSGLVAYDVFPHVGDVGIPQGRNSNFANTYDPTREVTLPEGYTISYYNGDAWPVYDGSSQDDVENVLAGLAWEPTPSVTTKAVRIEQQPNVELMGGQTIEFILPFNANAERLDAYGNPPQDLVGKAAYNSFFYQDNSQPELLEGNRVSNLLKARPISIEFVKYEKDTKKALAGATFALKDSTGTTIATAKSGVDGRVVFPNVAVRVGHRVVEVAAPDGYQVSPQERIITESDLSEGYAKNPAVIELGEFFNELKPPPPEYGRLEFKKLNSAGMPLPGTKFTLSKNDKKYGRLLYEATADGNGRVVFTNVVAGKGYFLQETQPIAPYQPVPNIGGIAIDPNQTTKLGKDFTVPGTGETIDNVIVNDKVQIRLDKRLVNDDRLVDKDGNKRAFGSFQAADGSFLSGSTFQVVEKSTGKVISSVSPYDSEKSLITGLHPNTVYQLRETYVPSRYEEIDWLKDTMFFQISNDGKLLDENGKEFPVQSALYVPNRAATQESVVTVSKVDQKSQPLAGAEFELQRIHKDEADGTTTWIKVGETVTTGSDGVAAFTLAESGRYRVVEKQNPAGYVGDYVSPEFIVQRTVAKTFTYSATNYRIRPTVAKIDYVARGLPDQGAALEVSKKHPGSTAIRRHGAWEVVKYLPGAAFDLREGDKDGAVIQHIETGDDGKAEITVDLDPDKSYVLVETEAPQGYAAAENPVTFIPATMMQFEPGREKGMFTVYVPNARETGRIVVSKTDMNSGLPLLDGQAEFTAQKVNKVTDGSEKENDIVIDGVRYRPDPDEKAHTKKTSKSGGVATFDKLSHGTWIVRETAAAKDFVVDDAPAIFEVSRNESSHTFVFANQGDPKIKLTKFINGQDANNKLTTVWLAPDADTMDVKFVVENTGKATLRDVTVTDHIEGAQDQYIDEALSHAVFTVKRVDGTVENNVPNSKMVLAPGDKAETTLEGMASPEVNKLHRNDATVVGTWKSPNDVTDADPAHAYRMPVGLPLPATGDQPWLIRLLIFGGLALLLGMVFARRAVRREA